MQDWMFIPIILLIGFVMVVGPAVTWRIATGRANKKNDDVVEERLASERQRQADPRGSREGA